MYNSGLKLVLVVSILCPNLAAADWLRRLFSINQNNRPAVSSDYLELEEWLQKYVPSEDVAGNIAAVEEHLKELAKINSEGEKCKSWQRFVDLVKNTNGENDCNKETVEILGHNIRDSGLTWSGPIEKQKLRIQRAIGKVAMFHAADCDDFYKSEIVKRVKTMKDWDFLRNLMGQFCTVFSIEGLTLDPETKEALKLFESIQSGDEQQTAKALVGAIRGNQRPDLTALIEDMAEQETKKVKDMPIVSEKPSEEQTARKIIDQVFYSCEDFITVAENLVEPVEFDAIISARNKLNFGDETVLDAWLVYRSCRSFLQRNPIALTSTLQNALK